MAGGIILASGSRQRADLLRSYGIAFTVRVSDIEERVLPKEAPDALVRRLAREKASVVAESNPDRIILGADTIVFFEDQIVGKPADLDEATDMYRRMSGRSHVVYTGCCLHRRRDNIMALWHASTAVSFKCLTEEEIHHCIATCNPLDKAGGYALQDHEEVLISEYRGLRSTVIGLPVEEVAERLQRCFGLPALDSCCDRMHDNTIDNRQTARCENEDDVV